MDGGGVSVSLAGDAGATAALALLVCFGVPGQTSHLNGTDPALLHESSSIAVILQVAHLSEFLNPPVYRICFGSLSSCF